MDPIDFLKRGLRKFANEADPFNNFKTDRNKAAPISEGNDDPKPMRTIKTLSGAALYDNSPHNLEAEKTVISAILQYRDRP